MEFKWYRLDDFVERHIDQWHRLGANALSPNIYLMPGFVVPAAKHLLDPLVETTVATVWNTAGQLRAAAFFTLKPPSLKFPFTRLVAFHSRHSYQSGLLVDKTDAHYAMRSLLQGISRRYQTVQFDELRTDTLTSHLLINTTRRLGLNWVWEKAYDRATLQDPHAALCALSAKRRRSLRRSWSKLKQSGTAEFSVLTGAQITDADIDAFLQLEASGWKGTSALMGNPANAQFYRAMASANRASGHTVMTQLKFNGIAIAATCNFAVGRDFFAFKTGFDPNFAKFGPGILIEHAFLKWCAKYNLYSAYDSGSQAGSFIENLCPARSQIASGTLLRTGISKLAFDLKTRVKFAGSAQPVLAASFEDALT